MDRLGEAGQARLGVAGSDVVMARRGRRVVVRYVGERRRQGGAGEVRSVAYGMA